MARPVGTEKKAQRKYLNQQEVKTFEAALEAGKNLRDEVAMRLTFRLGLRVGELARLSISDLNFDSHQITVKGLKNGRERTYDIDDGLWRKLARYVRQNEIKGRLFPVTIQALKFVFKRYAQRAGLPSHFSIHSLRHSIGVAMAERGASQIFIMKWLRHRSVSSSQIYFEELEDKKLDRTMNEKVFPAFM